jgi:integrating conjugative element protein (TIGR03757 family)
LYAGGEALQRRIGHAYQGVAEAWGLGVARIPAVVVDRRYVVYGEPDVPRAIARIDAYRGTQP